ncbi:ComF family protein [Streptomyces sp. NPDC093225]|uniref:ComF family protein n=1 Tax=Streptomyces sp. NPDC093225 TaxID=3366034 RepID=UPI00380D19B5
MRGWWRELAGLVLPVDCGGCGAPRVVLCEGCRREFEECRVRRVRPDPEPRGLPAVYAAAPYRDAVRAVLLAHKERGALVLGGVLGSAVARAVLAALAAEGGGGEADRRGGEGEGPRASGGRPTPVGPLVLVPVPSSRRAVRARGHDPVRGMALVAARELRRVGVAARVAPVLRQRRVVADQAALGARERFANLAGALELRPGGARLPADGRVVLVDDLMTTGASLAEAARALGTRPSSGGAGRGASGGVSGRGGVPGRGSGAARRGPVRGAPGPPEARDGWGGRGVLGLPAGPRDGRPGAPEQGSSGVCAVVVAGPVRAFESNWN